MLGNKKRVELQLEQKVESKKASTHGSMEGQRLIVGFLILMVVVGFLAGLGVNRLVDGEGLSRMRQKLGQYF